MESTYTEKAIWDIMDSAMKTALEFYQGDWIGFLEMDLEQDVITLPHWYAPCSEENPLELLKEIEPSELVNYWSNTMQNNAEIIVSDTLVVPVNSESTGFFVVRNPKKHMTESGKLQFLASVFSNLIYENNQVQKLKLALSPESVEYDPNIFGEVQINSEIYC